MLVLAVAVPAAGGRGIARAPEGRGRPGVDGGAEGYGKVGAGVDDPANGGGCWRWREEAGPQGGVCASAADDVSLWSLIWC